MKKVLSIMSFLVIVGLIVGCSDSSDKGGNNSDVSFADIYEDVQDKMKEDMGGNLDGYLDIDLLNVDPDDPSADIYVEGMDLDLELVENGRVIAHMMNVKSDQIILIEATDTEHVDSIKEALEKQLDNQNRTWEQYLPDQHEKVKNNIIKTNGKFLLYVTYDDEKAIEEVFDSHFE